MKRHFGNKAQESKGKWAICDICGLHKEGVQIRKKHLKDYWACNDCYKKAVISDSTFAERLKETRPQWKRRLRENKKAGLLK